MACAVYWCCKRQYGCSNPPQGMRTHDDGKPHSDFEATFTKDVLCHKKLPKMKQIRTWEHETQQGCLWVGRLCHVYWSARTPHSCLNMFYVDVFS